MFPDGFIKKPLRHPVSPLRPPHRCSCLDGFSVTIAGQPIPMSSPAPKQTVMTSDFPCLDFGSGQDIVDALAGWDRLPRTALLILSTDGQPEWIWVHYPPWVFPQQSELSAEESPEKLGTSQLHQRKVISLNKQILQKTKHLEEVSVFRIPLELMKLLLRGRIGRWMKSLVVDWSTLAQAHCSLQCCLAACIFVSKVMWMMSACVGVCEHVGVLSVHICAWWACRS